MRNREHYHTGIKPTIPILIDRHLYLTDYLIQIHSRYCREKHSTGANINLGRGERATEGPDRHARRAAKARRTASIAAGTTTQPAGARTKTSRTQQTGNVSSEK